VLETVGVGAGAEAELVDGAGAGAVLGGASVADLDGAGEACWLALAVTWAPAWGAGAAAWALADVVALARARLGWAFPGEELDGAGAGGDVFAVGAAVVSLAVVWAGAARANKVAKPSAVTALSWVARHVRRERRRRPAVRVAPGCSSGNSDLSRMTGDHSRA
jgi:hypothetical protein